MKKKKNFAALYVSTLVEKSVIENVSYFVTVLQRGVESFVNVAHL